MLKASSVVTMVDDKVVKNGSYLASTTTTLATWVLPPFTGGSYYFNFNYLVRFGESASKYLQLKIGSFVLHEVELYGARTIQGRPSILVRSDAAQSVPANRNNPLSLGLGSVSSVLTPATTAINPAISNNVTLELVTLAGTPTADWWFSVDAMRIERG